MVSVGVPNGFGYTIRTAFLEVMFILKDMRMKDSKTFSVITTNYPEKLDKALIRPGRIDMKVKFNKMTARSILEMYEYYFDTAAPPQFEHSGETKGLPDYKWSPAEVTQVFLNNMHCPEKALTQLMDSESLENIHLVPSNPDDNNNKNKSKASVI